MNRWRGLGAALCVALVLGLLSGCGGSRGGPLRIGVMLPFTGPDAVDAQKPLAWAADNVNAGGGSMAGPSSWSRPDLGRQLRSLLPGR